MGVYLRVPLPGPFYYRRRIGGGGARRSRPVARHSGPVLLAVVFCLTLWWLLIGIWWVPLKLIVRGLAWIVVAVYKVFWGRP